MVTVVLLLLFNRYLSDGKHPHHLSDLFVPHLQVQVPIIHITVLGLVLRRHRDTIVIPPTAARGPPQLLYHIIIIRLEVDHLRPLHLMQIGKAIPPPLTSRISHIRAMAIDQLGLERYL